jgi:hypothetical protein
VEYFFLIDKTFTFEYFMYFPQVAERDTRKIMMVGMQCKVEIRQNEVLPPSAINDW